MSHAFFFLASLAWNLGLGMTWLAVPLYAYSQGLSNAQIGVLFAAPVFAQAPLNLVGGAYTDRIGGRRILLGSSVATIAAGLWLMAAEGFWMLLVGQLVLVVSRAAFWPATWAMASELPGRARRAARPPERGHQLRPDRRHHAVRIPARRRRLPRRPSPCSPPPAPIALAAGLGTSAPPPKPAPPRHVLAAYLPLLRERIIAYTVMCAYLSALPFSLTMSFYPVLLANYGHSEEASGILLALRALGSIGASLLVARFVRTGPQTLWPVVCGVAVAAAVGLLPTVNHVVPIGFWMLVVGAGTAAMTLYFQVTISEASKPEERGSALALGGLGLERVAPQHAAHHGLPRRPLRNRHRVLRARRASPWPAPLAIAYLRHWAFRRP